MTYLRWPTKGIYGGAATLLAATNVTMAAFGNAARRNSNALLRAMINEEIAKLPALGWLEWFQSGLGSLWDGLMTFVMGNGRESTLVALAKLAGFVYLAGHSITAVEAVKLAQAETERWQHGGFLYGASEVYKSFGVGGSIVSITAGVANIINSGLAGLALPILGLGLGVGLVFMGAGYLTKQLASAASGPAGQKVAAGIAIAATGTSALVAAAALGPKRKSPSPKPSSRPPSKKASK